MWETFTAREKERQEKSLFLVEIFLPFTTVLFKITAICILFLLNS